MHALKKKKMKILTNNLSSHLKNTEKEEQNKLNRGKERSEHRIMKLRIMKLRNKENQ